ncbi:MAG TPA: hypothetical protein VKX16_13715 [Chloroflexota bacterium]|nr:hypothetical protein [Chloroflexota bacterium]
MLDTVVIGQDDQTELHVQAAMQGGRRHVDIRIWRRGPTGFAPSRNALTLDSADLNALQEGITELLEASDGGTQVARVVWDKDEGRRLRAETEPFGTRFLARLGFWQRVRDSWKPVGDGLVLQADQLKPLQEVLEKFKPRLTAESEPESERPEEPQDETLRRWPSPGADWITIESDRISFHPRGIRITGSIGEVEESHRLVLNQWKREDSLWIPEDTPLELTIAALDQLLLALHEILERPESRADADRQIVCADGSKLWPRIAGNDGATQLCIDVLPPPGPGPDLGFQTRLAMPAAYLPRFGRMLAHAGILLMGSMSEEERERLCEEEDLATPELVEEAPAALAEAARQEEQPANGHERGRYAGEVPEPSKQLVQNIILAARPSEQHTAVADGGPNGDSPEATIENSDVQRHKRLLTDLTLGHHTVFLYAEDEENPSLLLQWGKRSLQLPIDYLETLLSNLRALYYDALRGRRGPAVSVGDVAPVTLSVHHDGPAMVIALRQTVDGTETILTFPVAEAPVFLNQAGAVMARI